VSPVARFRLFGRAPSRGEGVEEPSPGPVAPRAPSLWGSWQAPPAGEAASWSAPGSPAVPPHTTSAHWPGGPATEAARPADFFAPPNAATDPPTDPLGLPPVPIHPEPDPAEAAALAGAFAVDYLSWDEDDPARRGRVLHDYLAIPGADPARLGWSGRGRQRAELALPGRIRPDGEGRVLVDVRVRVTPYRAVGERDPRPADGGPDAVGVPAVAPAPTGRGWRSLPSYWVRLSVPVVLENDRLAIDAWEETLDEPAAAAPAPEATGAEHTLADDDPLAEPAPGDGSLRHREDG
jgi:hypothetical protein